MLAARILVGAGGVVVSLATLGSAVPTVVVPRGELSIAAYVEVPPARWSSDRAIAYRRPTVLPRRR